MGCSQTPEYCSCPPKCKDEACIEKLAKGYVVNYKCNDYAFDQLCDAFAFVASMFHDKVS